MKPNSLIISLVVATLATATLARAELIASESFDYETHGKPGRPTKDGGVNGAGAEPGDWRDPAGQLFRPALVIFENCRAARVTDVHLRDPRFWTLHLLRCRQVALERLTIITTRPNGDGIDPDGCRDVTIRHCRIRSADDCIVLKSTDGAPCEDVTVEDCVLRSDCAALKLGTESFGDIRRVVFRRCRIEGALVALGLYMKDGGAFEQITFENLVIHTDRPYPVVVDITPRYPDRSAPGRIRDVTFRNLRVTARGRVYVAGQSGTPIENLRFERLHWIITGPFDRADVRKPAGSIQTGALPPGFSLEESPHLFLVVNARGFHLHDLTVQSPAADRGLIHLARVTDAVVENTRWERPSTVPD